MHQIPTCCKSCLSAKLILSDNSLTIAETQQSVDSGTDIDAEGEADLAAYLLMMHKPLKICKTLNFCQKMLLHRLHMQESTIQVSRKSMKN
jgi:hypothetical protein